MRTSSNSSCATPLNFRVADINRFMPFRQLARVMHLTHIYISPIKGSSSLTMEFNWTLCLHSSTKGDAHTIYETRASASHIANYIESSEPLFCSSLSADKAEERET